MNKNAGLESNSTEQGGDRLVRFTDALRMLGLKRSTAYRLIQKDSLPKPIKIGSMTYFSERELQDWIANKLASRSCGGTID
ncbi:AlpA family phage regulatory protein [Roseovarius nubinhibens]|uniref:helix-turn-helix transcriptional regulator n=1 Tax=Roseovarius nubinhibens TaxID=314263 RepID=UPI001C09A3FB|nr:AlpA family phage regulatory protein [Roseovarius nubinhibens]